MFHVFTIFLVYMQSIGVISWPWWGVVAPSIFVLSLWGVGIILFILLVLLAKWADR